MFANYARSSTTVVRYWSARLYVERAWRFFHSPTYLRLLIIRPAGSFLSISNYVSTFFHALPARRVHGPVHRIRYVFRAALSRTFPVDEIPVPTATVRFSRQTLALLLALRSFRSPVFDSRPFPPWSAFPLAAISPYPIFTNRFSSFRLFFAIVDRPFFKPSKTALSFRGFPGFFFQHKNVNTRPWLAT